MVRYKIRTILIICSCLFSACSDYPPDPIIEKPDVLLPLAIGNEWHYTEIKSDSANTQVSETDTVTYKVMQRLPGENQAYFAVQISRNSSSYQTFSYLANKSDGLWELEDNSFPFSYNLLFKYPAVVGDQYSQGAFIVTVRAIDTLVATADSSFFCYQYHFEPVNVQNYLSNSDIFYAPNIGYVKGIGRVFSDSVQISETILELTAFDLQK